MNYKNCLILDDEQHSINILTDYIQKTPQLNLVASFRNPIDAITTINQETIDIAFLDVQMPNLSGLQFLKLLKKETKVILCTAYAEYAVDGFELNVSDYLLKPISFERFLRAIQKLETNKNPNGDAPSNLQETHDLKYIFVKADSKGKFIKILLDDILYIEGLGNYVKIITVDKQIVTLLTMKNLENQIGEYGFTRIHKSFIVAISKITQIEGNKIVIGKLNIPLGDSYRDDILSSLKKSLIE
ncbi:MAG: LytR/AlgR family response regulator transcription factor [Leadbetterella sp.]